MATKFTSSPSTAWLQPGALPSSVWKLSVNVNVLINAQKNCIEDNYHCSHTLEFYPVVYLALVSWVLIREQWAWKLSGSVSVSFYAARIEWIEKEGCLTCVDCPSLHILLCICCFFLRLERLKIPVLAQSLADLYNQSLDKIRQPAFKEVDSIPWFLYPML